MCMSCTLSHYRQCFRRPSKDHFSFSRAIVICFVVFSIHREKRVLEEEKEPKKVKTEQSLLNRLLYPREPLSKEPSPEVPKEATPAPPTEEELKRREEEEQKRQHENELKKLKYLPPPMLPEGCRVLELATVEGRTGGTYIPPQRLAYLRQTMNIQKSEEERQKESWVALKKSITGIINKV